MVAPVTGPFTTYPTASFTDIVKQGYRQAKPYNQPLAYILYKYFGISYLSSQVSWNGTVTQTSSLNKQTWGFTSDPDYTRVSSAVHNKAYEKLRAKLSDSSGWAENIAQAGKTRQLVVQYASTLKDVVLDLKRGRFDRAAAALNLTREPKNVSRRRGVAANFLEFEYGVKPLISDLQDSMTILTGDPGVRWLRASAHERILRRSFIRTGNPNSWDTTFEVISIDLQETIRVGVQVVNPNIFLANQLGLIDLALPWKLMPFSFIVDWFVNVEQVISSFTDWFGVLMIHPHTTKFHSGARNRVYNAVLTEGTKITTTHNTVNQHSVEMVRSLGISGPTLIVRPFKGFSMERGAQALALVSTVLGGKTHSPFAR